MLILRLVVMEDLVEPHDIGIVGIQVHDEELRARLLIKSIAVAVQRIQQSGASPLLRGEPYEHPSATRGERLAKLHASTLRRREQSHLSQPRRSPLASLGKGDPRPPAEPSEPRCVVGTATA